ncbi:IS256 family transposase [Aeromonas media WS]|nr:IS256 family transposase [Aeromonas media WS]
MGKQMDQDKLKALAAELAKDIKSEKDLGTLTQQLIKLTVETALNAEMDEHLGYEKHAPQGRGTGNNRNGYSIKRLKGQHGEVTIQAPRDRVIPPFLGAFKSRGHAACARYCFGVYPPSAILGRSWL